jgi:hypothetical protein
VVGLEDPQSFDPLEAELGANHVTVASTLDKLARLQLERGDALAALSAGERALPILEQALGHRLIERGGPRTASGRLFPGPLGAAALWVSGDRRRS